MPLARLRHAGEDAAQFVLLLPQSVLLLPQFVLLLPQSVLLLPQSVLLLPQSVLLLPQSVLLLPQSVLLEPQSALPLHSPFGHHARMPSLRATAVLSSFLLACGGGAPIPTDGGRPVADGGLGGLGDGGLADGGVPDGGAGAKELPAPTHIGQARPAKVLVPADYDGRAPRPAIFLLGGYDYHSADLDDWIAISDLVDALGFILVMPDGLVDSAGSPYWNATDTCCDFDHTGVDDVGYLRGLTQELVQRFAVDVSRIGMIGHSAGGFMAFRLACEELPINAIVSLAGSTFNDESLCHPSRPISVLQVHGLADDVMPFNGDRDAPGALELLRRWSLRAHCEQSGLHDDPTRREYVTDHRTDETTVRRYSGCDAPYDVGLWQLTGADHYPNYRPVFTHDAVTWLLGQRRPN